MRFRRSTPVPPVNVRLECEDGRVIPLELVYVGKRKRLHVWTNATRVIVYSSFSLCLDMLPARTTVDLDFLYEVPG